MTLQQKPLHYDGKNYITTYGQVYRYNTIPAVDDDENNGKEFNGKLCMWQAFLFN